MSLPEKYELLDLIAQNETCTYLARERATVRMVMVHLLLPGPNRISLLEMVLRARMIPASPGRLKILDLGEHEGNPLVVTEIIPGFSSLREWLQAEIAFASAAQPAAPAPAPAPAAPERQARRDPGEFTQLFQAVMSEIPTTGGVTQEPVVPPPVAAEAPKGPTPPAVSGPQAFTPPKPAPRQSESGEFTRMFQAGWSQPPALPQEPTAPVSTTPGERLPADAQDGELARWFQSPAPETFPSPPAPGPRPTIGAPPAVGKVTQEPGEFTRIFQQGLPVSPPEGTTASPLPGPAPATAEPGEFTRMFQSPLAPQPLESQIPPATPPPVAGFPTSQTASPWPGPASPAAGHAPPSASLTGGPGGSSAGDFTRLFGAPAGAPPVPSPPLTGPAPGGATQLFSMPAAPVPSVPGGAQTGPGDFTRVVSAVPGLAEAPASPAPAPQATPTPAVKPTNLPLWIIAGSVLVIVILLVVYFLLRR